MSCSKLSPVPKLKHCISTDTYWSKQLLQVLLSIFSSKASSSTIPGFVENLFCVSKDQKLSCPCLSSPVPSPAGPTRKVATETEWHTQLQLFLMFNPTWKYHTSNNPQPVQLLQTSTQCPQAPYTQTNRHTHRHIDTHTCKHAHAHTHTHTQACACAHTHTHAHMYTHTHTHMHKHTYTHTHTHTHTHIHITYDYTGLSFYSLEATNEQVVLSSPKKVLKTKSLIPCNCKLHANFQIDPLILNKITTLNLWRWRACVCFTTKLIYEQFFFFLQIFYISFKPCFSLHNWWTSQQ